MPRKPKSVLESLPQIIFAGISNMEITDILKEADDQESIGIPITVKKRDIFKGAPQVNTYSIFTKNPDYTFGIVTAEFVNGGTTLYFKPDSRGLLPIIRNGYHLHARLLPQQNSNEKYYHPTVSRQISYRKDEDRQRFNHKKLPTI